MVGAVTGTTSSLSSVSSSSSGSAALEAQLAAKQAELAEAKSEEDKTKINEEIAKLKSQLSALKATEKQDTAQQQKTATAANTNRATVGVTSAEKAAPESRVPSEVMDVLMKMRPGGGSAEADKAGPPDFSKLYSDMDTDDDGSVTKSEFVSASADRLSAEDAGKLFDALDGEKSGSISEDQFTSMTKPPAGGRPPMGPPPEGMTPPNQIAQQSADKING